MEFELGLDVFVEKFGKPGKFLRSALFAFSNQDLMEVFKDRGLELKVERQGRVFPATDKAESILEVLTDCIKEAGFEVLCDMRIVGISKKKKAFSQTDKP